METTARLEEAARGWGDAATALLAVAERIGPLQADVFRDLSADEGEAAATEFEAQVEMLVTEGEHVDAELGDQLSSSDDARFRLIATLVGTLGVADALAVASQTPSDVSAERGVKEGGPVTFPAAREQVAEAQTAILGARSLPSRQVEVPATLGSSLEELETTGAEELTALVSSTAGRLAGAALLGGLEAALTGAAAAAFQALKKQLNRIRDAIKRGVVRLTEWVVEKLKSLLPAALRSKVDDLVAKVQEQIDQRLPGVAADVLGKVLGRADVERAWAAAAERSALGDAESKLPGIVDVHTDRIGWVTKARGYVDRLDRTVMQAALAAAGPHAQLAYAALVALVIAFLGVQVWDGFNDVQALVET